MRHTTFHHGCPACSRCGLRWGPGWWAARSVRPSSNQDQAESRRGRAGDCVGTTFMDAPTRRLGKPIGRRAIGRLPHGGIHFDTIAGRQQPGFDIGIDFVPGSQRSGDLIGSECQSLTHRYRCVMVRAADHAELHGAPRIVDATAAGTGSVSTGGLSCTPPVQRIATSVSTRKPNEARVR